jgi:hypothetical protein
VSVVYNEADGVVGLARLDRHPATVLDAAVLVTLAGPRILLMEHVFPDYFPSDCPPKGAAECGGAVYRFVAGDPPASGDFLSHYERGLAPKADPCLRCGLSVFMAVEVAVARLKELRERFPGRKFGNHVAEGNLDSSHGKIMQTGRDREHQTWWPYEGIDRCGPFKIVRTIPPNQQEK